MIFKVLLKYKIFEWCLETIFEKINNNFSKVEIKGMRVGDRVNKIKYFTYGKDGNLNKIFRYYDCTILRIDINVIKFSYNKMRESPLYVTIDAYGIRTYCLSDIEFCK